MEIIGRGFIARNLQLLSAGHPDTVVMAAGVSSTRSTAAEDYAREVALVAEYVRKCTADGRRLVFFSTASSGVYGAPGCSGREDVPVVPTTPYARHKLRLEEEVRASGVDYLVLRLSHLVGSHQRGHQLVPALVGQIRQGLVQVHRGASRDLLGAADMVRILHLLLERGTRREVVNVASGYPVPIESVIRYIEHLLGVHPRWQVTEHTAGSSRVDVSLLRRLVPEVDGMGFGPLYYRRLIDAHLDRGA